MSGIDDMNHVHLHGPAGTQHRVSTFAVSVEGSSPTAVASHLIQKGIYVWSGHYYAVNVMDRFGVLDRGGLVRIGFVHYNTSDEVERTLAGLASLG